MKNCLLLFVMQLFCSGLSFSQISHHALNQKAAIIKNKVSEIREYPVQDSTAFFREHPNGYYARFNEGGKIIEKNNYSYGSSDEVAMKEERTYFFYDDDGEMIGRVELSSDTENPVNSVSLIGKDSARNSMNYMDLHNFGNGFASLHLNEQVLDTTSVNWNDTVRLSRSHIRVPWFAWEDSVFWEDVYLDKKGRVDSSERIEVVMSKPYLENHRIKTRYLYASDGSLKQKVRTSYDTRNKSYRIEELYYDQTGLLYLYRERYLPLNRVEESRFVYTFRTK